ncbi:MAG: hypothetical protein P8L45_10130 [Longimicrobiales bacterium]|nr:hypothetical protein [Longimicrobiales bacterium]
MGPPAAAGHVLRMRGHTLIELTIVLFLTAIGVSSLVPTARALRDWAVASAGREVLVAGFHDARASAVRHGGATLTIRRAPPAFRVETPEGDALWVPLDEVSVRLRLDAGRDSIAVEFDRMGIGRLASHSIEVVVGSVSRRLVVSSYGRIRRR